MVAALTEVEFDLTWDSLGLAERPYPLDVPSFGRTTDERARLAVEVRESLATKGLHDGTDLDREFEDQLLMLARNDFSVDALLSVGQNLRVLGAGRGTRGALAVQAGEHIRVGRVGTGGVLAEILGLVPEVAAGPGNPVTLAKSVFHAAIDAHVESGFGGLETALNRGGVSGRDMRTIKTLIESSRDGGGQVAANSLDRLGRRTRTEVVNWFDTEAGRYLCVPQHRQGTDWLTFTPADSARLAARLRELVVGVRA